MPRPMATAPEVWDELKRNIEIDAVPARLAHSVIMSHYFKGFRSVMTPSNEMIQTWQAKYPDVDLKSAMIRDSAPLERK